MSPADHLLEQALSLSPAERVRVAAELMRSGEGPTRAEVVQAWAEEADRRMERLRAGLTTAAPAEQAIDDASAWLRSRRP